MEEARGLWDGDATRPRDLVVLDFSEPGRHLVLDGVVMTVYRNSILSKVAAVPGFAAKQVEDTKFKADMASAHPISAAYGGWPTFVPFAMEDGGRIGAHGHAFLRMLTDHAVAKGKLTPGPRNATPPPPGGGILVGPQVATSAIHVAPPHLVPLGSAVPCTLRYCGGVLLLDCLHGSTRSQALTVGPY